MKDKNYFACSGAEWSCTFGGHGTIKKSDSKVTMEDRHILTTKDKPQLGCGMCSAVNGKPCTPQVFPLWRKTSKVTYCNNKVLLDGSSILCFYGGTITIKDSRQTKIEYNGSFFSRLEFSSLPKPYQKMLERQVEQQSANSERHKKDAHKENPIPKTSTFHLASSNSKIKKHLSQTAKNDDMTLDEPNKTYTEPTAIQSNLKPQSEFTSPPVPSPALLRQKHWCSGNCPEEYKNACGFRTAPCQLRYENDSGSLKKNLRNKYNSLYEVMVNISNTQIFSIAHHHLIPGNECYSKMDGDHRRYELLLKLGYFFDYDINISENGILLPAPKNTNEMEEKNNTEDTRAIQYYHLMDKDLHNSNLFMDFSQVERSFVGSQLHCGPHTYERPLKKLREKHPEAYKLRSYESIVIAELDLLSNYYMDMYEDTCFMKDYEKNKKEFFNRINNMSNRLRERIIKFPNRNKTLSYLNKRLYVSFPAILYDMDISLSEYQENYLNPKNT